MASPVHSNVASPRSQSHSTIAAPTMRSGSCSPPCLSPDSTCDLNKVHEELEKLNIATDVINKLEMQLDEARNVFREIQSGWSNRLEQLIKKLGACIERSRPYYEARLKVLEAQQEVQRAALRFERANSMHAIAKQQVSMTQEGLNRQGSRQVEPACLEVLNYHVQQVNEAESERISSEHEHKRISRIVVETTAIASRLEQELRRDIKKSKTYFEARVEFTKVLDKQKELIQRLEAEIRQKKADYNRSLRNLEQISEDIHERRQTPGFLKDQQQSSAPVQNHNETRDDSSAPPSDPEDRRSDKGHNPTFNFDRATTTINRCKESLTSNVRSGVILLAQELSLYDWLDEQTRLGAFNMPVVPSPNEDDRVDVRYQTAPLGVKPFPSPPETPGSAPASSEWSSSNRDGGEAGLVDDSSVGAVQDSDWSKHGRGLHPTCESGKALGVTGTNRDQKSKSSTVDDWAVGKTNTSHLSSPETVTNQQRRVESMSRLESRPRDLDLLNEDSDGGASSGRSSLTGAALDDEAVRRALRDIKLKHNEEDNFSTAGSTSNNSN